MEDLYRKRRLIERGILKTWPKRGRGSWRAEKHQTLCALLRVVLKVTGLEHRGRRNALAPIVRPVRLVYKHLPEAFCGLTILHLTDLHADGLRGMAEVVGRCLQGLAVDLCVMTGDYRFATSGSCEATYPPMQHILTHVNSRLGVFGILGNHDVSDKIPVLEQMGVRMLVNAAHELRYGRDSLWIVGVDDPHYYGCDDLPGALRGVPEEAFKILLVHSPEIIPEAEAAGIDLYLCGHTHGGQICLPLVGPIISNSHCPRRYTRGVWQYRRMRGYTSTGVGASGVPVRFFCPPEIGLIELCCPKHASSARIRFDERRVLVEGEERATVGDLAAV